MARVCGERGVSLTAAALQFALRHPAVSAVVVGARSADEVRADVAAAAVPIPDDLWDTLAVL
jgi:D-threo-aldose 1-dehydrogenase